MLFVCKSFWHASMLAVKTPRRLHTARIDLKLCEDVADDAGRPSMFLKRKKKKLILPGIEPGISGSVDRRLIHWATGPWCRRKLSSCVRGEIALDFMTCIGKLKICKGYQADSNSRPSRTIRGGLTIPARSTHPHSPPQRGVRLRDARVGDGIRAMVRPHDFEQVGATKPRLFR